ncbi:MAG: PIN domain-containing protein [Candidatus Amesbacteria bacterium]|nr:PIN domain-containing protein [Candidatus Amesbacteria bacterium]
MSDTVIIDTNIILRYFLDNNLVLEKLVKSGRTLFITFPIIFEVVYVMERFYKIHREQIYEKLMSLITRAEVELEDKMSISTLNKYRAFKSLSIADAYLAELSKYTGYELITFDKKLKKNV